MPVQLKVKNNVKDVIRSLDKIQKKQIPFATAVSLTWTAKDCQAGIIEQIQKVFNNTKKWWLPRQPTGVKIISATKQTLTSWIYTRAFFASLQEYGGIKTPWSGKSLLIPDKRSPKYARRSGGHRKVFANPKTLHHNGSPFIDTGKGVKVLQRKGKSRYPLKPIYNVEPRAKIDKRMDFRGTAQRIAEARFSANFLKALAKYGFKD